MSSKSEQPTRERLARARREGQTPRSKTLSASAGLMGAIGGAALFVPGAVGRLIGLSNDLLSGAALESGAGWALRETLSVAAALSIPPLVGGLLSSCLAQAYLNGGLLDAGFISPKLERVDPFAGLRRLFSAGQLAQVGKSLITFVVLGAVLARGLVDELPSLTRLPLVSMGAAGPLLERLAVAVLGTLVILSVLDYGLERWLHVRRLRMSRQEVLDEHKRAEGDPAAKHRRRAVHRQLAQSGPARGVQRASVVIVNPTHLAVALRYDAEECEAPYLVAKGADADARRIRLEAMSLGVPVLKDVPLARSLVRLELGTQIPEELYEAAAAVLNVALTRRGSPLISRGEDS